SFEQRGSILEAREDAQAPGGLAKSLETGLRPDALGEAFGLQDLDRAREVDIRHLARLDLGLGCRVEGALWLIRHAREGLSSSLAWADCPRITRGSQSAEPTSVWRK